MSFLSLLPTTIFTVLVFGALLCESCSVTRRPATLGIHTGWISVPSDIDRLISTPAIMAINAINAQLDSQDVLMTLPSLIGEMAPPPLPSVQPKPPPVAGEPRLNPKRLSLNLPSQSASSSPRRQSILSLSSVPSRPLTPESALTSPDDSNQFLTAVAGQERRVLELKEELAKAEAELAKLKTQWAVHEAKKKRNEVINHVPLRLMTSPTQEAGSPGPSDSDRSRALLSRRQTIQTRARQPRRFEGGTHTRTLSLLSPTSMAANAAGGSAVQGTARHQLSMTETQSRLASAELSPYPLETSHRAAAAATAAAAAHQADPAPSGKSLVGDLREGLWTFIEDLKQATVGDEAVTGARARQTHGTPKPLNHSSRRNSPTTAQHPAASARIASTEKSNTPVEKIARTEAMAKSVRSEQACPTDDKDDDDDDWDDWETTPPITTSTGTAGSTPRTSMRFAAARQVL